jgi:hypothetical protein
MTSRFHPRDLLSVSTILAAAIALGIATIASADDVAAKADVDVKDAAASAPVKRIVLFNSGVGYFERQGTVDGDASIELEFDVDDVNDLLKSMVLEDRGGGQISTVAYASRDPITKTLGTFAIDLTDSPSLGQLLQQIRGERVEIEAPSKIEGVIVGVEKQREPVPEAGAVEIEYLNLLTDDGLRRFELGAIGRIKLADEKLNAEFRQALRVLAASHAQDKKSVTLNFLGEGQREVRVGYIQEAPVWKTSYRLVLDDEGEPLVQGWAIVENTTDADWNDVRLSLVSGRPISFTMDLYSPLYAQRPVETLDLHATLRPQVYDQDLSGDKSLARRGDRYSAAAPASEGASPDVAARTAVPRGRMTSGFGGALSDAYASDALEGEALQQSVQAAAQGGDVGELFQYEIENPVTLPRQSSAMLPIINDRLEGKKVSIYNQSVHAKHPLNGVELKNTSDLHLMQGPATVFDGGVYAGDAKLPDLPAGGERLISYALDLAVEVAPTTDAKPQQLASLKIAGGVLTASYKQQRTREYALKNSGDDAKTVLVELPIENRWKLVTPEEPTEKTRNMYRFAVEVDPGESTDLTIEEEQLIRQQIAVTDLDLPQLQIHLNAKEVSAEVKEALEEIVRRRTELAKLAATKERLAREIATIEKEQARIRPNMEAIDRNTDLYNRYVKKLADQEDQIEKLRKEFREADEEHQKAQQSLDEYLNGLNPS